jgi:purine-binding chemotaxis protein CheW
MTSALLLDSVVQEAARLRAAPTDLALVPLAQGSASDRVLMFSLAGRVHCAALASVREIIPIQPATRLPGAAGHVRGLINLRGNIVTVIDAAMCEYGVVADDAGACILVVERDSGVAGIVVDAVHDMGLLQKDISVDALLDLRSMVQMALA